MSGQLGARSHRGWMECVWLTLSGRARSSSWSASRCSTSRSLQRADSSPFFSLASALGEPLELYGPSVAVPLPRRVLPQPQGCAHHPSLPGPVPLRGAPKAPLVPRRHSMAPTPVCDGFKRGKEEHIVCLRRARGFDFACQSCASSRLLRFYKRV